MKTLRKLIKSIIFKTPILKAWYMRGYFSPSIRRQRFVNFIFQRILRQNADSPWSVHYTSRVTLPHKIKIGDGVAKSFMLSGGCYIQGGNGIEIGEGTIFAPGVKIISANHDPHNLRQKWISERPIKIGRHCWIGANAVILPGVELGDHVIVGAGTVVTKAFPDGATIVGNPARELDKPPEEREEKA